jgi:membrane associated rhomboid family serine protease
VLIFVACAAAGGYLTDALEVYPAIGANGAALGLLCAWLVDDRLANRRGDDRENDLLGVYVIAAVLVLLSLTTEAANIAAAVGGALAGAFLGLLLPRLTRRA